VFRNWCWSRFRRGILNFPYTIRSGPMVRPPQKTGEYDRPYPYEAECEPRQSEGRDERQCCTAEGKEDHHEKLEPAQPTIHSAETVPGGVDSLAHRALTNPLSLSKRNAVTEVAGARRDELLSSGEIDRRVACMPGCTTAAAVRRRALRTPRVPRPTPPAP
jgi:hypothetical protein